MASHKHPGLLTKIMNSILPTEDPTLENMYKPHYKQAQSYMEQYQGKNIIVTGASGEIGRKIVAKL